MIGAYLRFVLPCYRCAIRTAVGAIGIANTRLIAFYIERMKNEDCL